MAITIDWATQIISVPKADTQLVAIGPPEIRQLDIDVFRLTLKKLEGEEEGMPFILTHVHNPPVTVGGVTLARVVEIVNGYTVTFEDGQYAVNLVGANSNIADVANVNQVSIRSANSAGLTFSEQINAQSFIDATVFIDIDNGLAGTGFPRGTPTDPVNNYTDATAIATARNLRRFNVFGTLVTGGGDVLDNQIFKGDSSVAGIMTLTAGVATEKTTFLNLTLSGTADGIVDISRTHVNDLAGFEGILHQCDLNGTITADTTANTTLRLIDCASDLAGTATPIFDINDADCPVSIRKYAGGIQISGLTSGNNVSIDMLSGHVVLDASCTSGTIVVRGVCKLTNNATCTVVTDGLVEELVATGPLASNLIGHIWAAS